jgi:hypothetical protein
MYLATHSIRTAADLIMPNKLLSLIAQVDTQISIQLAKDSKELAHASKQDSSAMKIIAVLTTLFLPGTFLAVWQNLSYQQATYFHFVILKCLILVDIFRNATT